MVWWHVPIIAVLWAYGLLSVAAVVEEMKRPQVMKSGREVLWEGLFFCGVAAQGIVAVLAGVALL